MCESNVCGNKGIALNQLWNLDTVETKSLLGIRKLLYSDCKSNALKDVAYPAKISSALVQYFWKTPTSISVQLYIASWITMVFLWAQLTTIGTRNPRENNTRHSGFCTINTHLGTQGTNNKGSGNHAMICASRVACIACVSYIQKGAIVHILLEGRNHEGCPHTNEWVLFIQLISFICKYWNNHSHYIIICIVSDIRVEKCEFYSKWLRFGSEFI